MKADIRVARTKDGLRKALLDSLKEKPLQKIRISDLTKQAGVSRKVFYDHYSSIYDLVLDCYDAFCVDPLYVVDGVDMRLGCFDSKKDATIWFIECATKRLEFCRENPQFAQVAYVEALSSPYLINLANRSVDITKEYLEDECRRKELGDGLLTKDFVARYVFLGDQFIIHDWVKDGMKESIDRVACRMIYMSLYVGGCLHIDGSADQRYLEAVLEYDAQKAEEQSQPTAPPQ
ncbi:MAG: TetR/AcrR family transcriptional regulator [Gordonibacter sp.]|uniref:TetR/AcrR family transcriptional regulator n=1 Tax=Gordonibacter sp. TaxID=1968902 RepID=UPI002FCAF54A